MTRNISTIRVKASSITNSYLVYCEITVIPRNLIADGFGTGGVSQDDVCREGISHKQNVEMRMSLAENLF
jgi:hypothetical protein